MAIFIACAAGAGTTASGPSGDKGPRSVSRVTSGDTFLLQYRQVVGQVGTTGVIEPDRKVEIVAPFDGAVKQRLFEYGERVERGQPLIVLDSFDLEPYLREAEAANLKAAQTVRELEAWTSGPEAIRARRAVDAAELQLRSTQQKVQSTKRLLDRGIVAQQEYADLLDQQQAQVFSRESARQDLESVLKRGGSENVLIAKIELEGAVKRLDELRAELMSATIVAPVSGIILRPSGDEQGVKPIPEVGGRVSKAQKLLTVADLDHLVVTAQVDETDVNHVREGQEASVSSGGFGADAVMGRVAYVAAQSSPATDGSHTVLFDIRVDLAPLTNQQKSMTRVGMSADVEICYYNNPKALVVPTDWIKQNGTRTSVLRQNPVTGELVEVPVSLGMSTLDGVEIKDGLNNGDILGRM